MDLNNELWNAISNMKNLCIRKDDLDTSISKIERIQLI